MSTQRGLAVAVVSGAMLALAVQAGDFPRLETSEKQLDEMRKTALCPVPDAKADYVFGIDQLKPAWEGMAGMRVLKDRFGKGMDGLEFNPGQEGSDHGLPATPSAMYWKLTGIPGGKYYVGLWVEVQEDGGQGEYQVAKLMASAYLNGWPMRFATSSEPVQVQPGRWLAELQTAEPVELKPDDELTVRPFRCTQAFLRLALHRQEPRRGHGVTGQTFGTSMWAQNPPRLRLVIEPAILGTGEAGSAHQASVRVANPLPYAADAVIDWRLADFFGAPIAGKAESVRLAPHAVKEITHTFAAEGDAQAYQLDVKTHAAPGFVSPVERPREMIELNDWGKLELLPNQPGPLEAWYHVRRDLGSDKTGSRMSVCLDGDDWERGLLSGRRVPPTPPADIVYKRCRVPDGDGRLPKDVFGKWYRKKFRVPEWMKGETFLLEVNAASCEGTVFLNGERIGRGLGNLRYYYPPIVADVTKLLKTDGENEVVICVRNYMGLVRDDYVDKCNPNDGKDVGTHLDWPPSDDSVAGLGGQWIQHNVWLRTAPAVRTRQTLVVPDVEANTLLVLNRVENRGDQPRTVEVRHQVFQEGVAAKADIPPQTVTVPPGAIVEVKALGNGKGLRPYTPASPTLARLVTTIAEDGAVRDIQEQRFGYRTVKVKGTGLTLNGQPVKLLGSGPFFSAVDYFERLSGSTISRTTLRPFDSLELFDEVGRFGYGDGGGVSVESREILNNSNYWEHARAAGVEMVWGAGSHPCVAPWDVANETYHYSVYSVGPDGQDKGGERIFSIVEAIRNKVWPHFWFFSDGNDRLGGRLDFFSWHYLNHIHAIRQRFDSTPRGFWAKDNGITHYPPDCFFIDGAASPPRPDTVIPSPGGDWKFGETACGATEEFEFFNDSGPLISRYIGDRATLSSACQYGTARGLWLMKLAVEGYRDMEQAFTGSLYWGTFNDVIAQGVTFSLPQQEIRYYSGAPFVRRFTVHDDEFAPGELELTWRLLDSDGKVVKHGGTGQMKSATTYLKRGEVSFQTPAVKNRTNFVLNVELRKNGKVREHEQRVVEVWPALRGIEGPALNGDMGRDGSLSRPRRAEASAPYQGTPVVPAVPIALFDPEGKTQAVLERFGCRVKRIGALIPEALAGSHCLVVGPDCATPGMVAEQQAIRAFAAAGGRVLVLPQTDAALLPADTYINKQVYSSIGFVRSQNHPIMQGLADRDFAMWNPGHLIARGQYRTPDKGNFRVLVDCGSMTLAWTPLFEVYVGQGSILATQLPLLTNIDTEPMAAEMWQRILNYMTQDVYRRPTAKLAVLAGASEPLVSRLQEIRAEYDTVAAPDASKPVMLMEMNQPDFSQQTKILCDYVKNGGTLVLHRVRPEHKAWLANLLGRPVNIEIQPYQSWVDRQAVDKRDGLAEGINNVDLYWRRRIGGADNAQVSRGVIEGQGQVEYVVKVANAPDHLFPGGWVEIPLEHGRIVIDQLKWELPDLTREEEYACGSPTRTASLWLTNLGVLQRPPLLKPTLPKDVAYEPIDISALANRGIRDDVVGDGEGWEDLGPQADLRDFPTGDIRLTDIPFRVPKGNKNAIVLRANPASVASLAKYPESVTIPVGKKDVAGLVFLHTGAWIGQARREIHYADGTIEALAVNKTNMSDWRGGQDVFPLEEGTTTTVAWKGKCPMASVTRVYKTLWLNPHPEKEITKVVLTTEGLSPTQCGFLANLGLTAVMRSTSAAEQAPRDVPKSQTLFQEAWALIRAGKTADAATRLEGALQADNQNTSAWMELTTIHAKADDVAAFSALCRRWFQAMPANYQAHNVLAEFLDKKGKPAEALAEFRQSLEIEGNQPPTGQAIERLERQLGLRK